MHHRRSIRLPGYNYAQPGYYFITICLLDVRCILATWGAGKMQLTQIGKIAQQYWQEIPEHYPDASVDEFVIMPDHVHGILVLVRVRHGEPVRENKYQHIIPKSLGMIINQFKSAVTRWCRCNGFPQFQWQRGFYEHIVPST